ncbi:hypothetical protein Emed_003194 [Eimeria media]
MQQQQQLLLLQIEASLTTCIVATPQIATSLAATAAAATATARKLRQVLLQRQRKLIMGSLQYPPAAPCYLYDCFTIAATAAAAAGAAAADVAAF